MLCYAMLMGEKQSILIEEREEIVQTIVLESRKYRCNSHLQIVII